MRKELSWAALALSVGMPALAGDSVTGLWEGHITNERGEHIITKASLLQEGDAVTGTLSMYGMTAMPVCKGVFDGQVLKFEIDRNWSAGKTCADLEEAAAIRFEGRVKGPSLSGTADDGKIKGALFWIHEEEPAAPEPTAAPKPTEPAAPEPTATNAPEPTATNAPEPTQPAVQPTQPAVQPTQPAAQPTQPVQPTKEVSPYDTARAYITAVRGDAPDAFVAIWNAKDRQEGSTLKLIYEKARPKLRQIADAIEVKLTGDAFRLQGNQALLSYECTSRSGEKQVCVFTLTKESDGGWYIEDLD